MYVLELQKWKPQIVFQLFSKKSYYHIIYYYIFLLYFYIIIIYIYIIIIIILSDCFLKNSTLSYGYGSVNNAVWFGYIDFT